MSAPARIPPVGASQDWLGPGRFALLAACFLFALFPGVFLGADAFFFRDYGALGYPLIHHARESFWSGELPMWNPLSHCGAPFLAQWGTMALYPFSLIYLLLPLPWSLSFFCFAHLALAGAGMFLLARRWLEHAGAAAVAGTAFVFNGFTLACLLWPNYTAALGWMPWVVLLCEQAWQQGRGRLLWAVMAATLQMLTGVPEIILLTWLVVGVLWGVRLLGLGRTPSVAGAAGVGSGALVARLAVVVILTAALSAAQLLPFFDLLAHSQRERGALGVKWAMPAWGWANLLVPLFHCFQTPQGQFFQRGQEFLSSYYLGAPVLGLAAWGCIRVRHFRVWVLAGLALVGLVLALGEATPIYALAKRLVPLAGLIRYPVKFVALAAFAVPLLAGFGFRELSNPVADGPPGARLNRLAVWRPLLWIAGVATLLSAGILFAAWRHPFEYDQWDVTLRNGLARLGFLFAVLFLLGLLRAGGCGQGWLPRAASVALPLLIFLDAATHTPRQNPTLPASVFTPGLWEKAVSLPPPRLGSGRLMISPEAEKALLHSSVADPEKSFLGKRLAQWSNLNLLDGLPKVNGAMTLQLREQMQVQTALYGLTNLPLKGLKDFLGVSHVSAPGAAIDWVARPGALPLVTAGQTPVFLDGTNAVAAMAADSFDPRETVILPTEAQPWVRAREKTSCTVEAVLASAHRVVCDVEAPGPAVVVFSQTYYHPWEPTVDDQPARLWRANHAFQAIEVPPGKHRVVLVYRDRGFRAGAALGAAALLGIGLYLLRCRRSAGMAEPTLPPEANGSNPPNRTA